MSNEANHEIPLSTLVSSLRTQLKEAIDEGEGQDLRFTVQGIELELEVCASWERDGTRKVKFWVFEAGAGAKQGGGTTQRLKLQLVPKRDDASSGGPVELSRKSS